MQGSASVGAACVEYVLTVALKAADPLAWVQGMNSIQARVREIMNDELICN